MHVGCILIALLSGHKNLILRKKETFSLFFYKHQGGVYAFWPVLYVSVYIYISTNRYISSIFLFPLSFVHLCFSSNGLLQQF